MKAIMRDEREMKDSGIEWIGKIPLSWECCKQKYKIQLINGRAYKDSEFEENGKYKILRVGNLFSNPNWYTSSLELEDEKYCVDGDLLYAWSMSYGPYIWSGDKVIYHYHIWKAKLAKDMMVRFSYYYYVALTNNIRAESHETTMGFVTMGNMNNSYIAVPSSLEQQAIADYLDDRCSKIDTIITEAKASIEEYKELKQAVIYEAVTKGIDKNVPMKDSGVEWIGQIPNYMTVKKIKYVTQISRGLFGYRPRNAAFLYDGPYPFIQTGDVARANHYITEYKQTLSEEGKKVSRLFPKGTLTMTIAANVGDVSILGFDAYFPDSVLGFIPYDKYSSEYLYYIFSAMKEEFVLNAISNTQLNLNVERVKELYIPVLEDVEQQKKLIDYLDSKTEKIDEMISEKQSLIEDLEVYKKSLIYEVVTGKRKVVA